MSGKEDKLQTLWTAATWRYPWRQAQPLVLNPTIEDPLVQAARIYNLPQLLRCPPEIQQMIWEYSAFHLEKIISVVKLAERLFTRHQDEPRTLPICDVSWYRGSDPIIRKLPGGSMIRLTIDSLGVKRIESNQEMAKICDRPRGEVVYVMEPAENLLNVCAEFKVRFRYHP